MEVIKEDMDRYCLGNATCFKKAKYRVISVDKAGNHEETALCEDHKPQEYKDDKEMSM